MSDFDLLSTVEYGGCSAKLEAEKLTEALADLPATPHPDLLVNTDTHDDAGVFRISDDLAIIQTTDFFPPICSDPYEFGQIAAANAMSDVYAMGGKVLTALNLVCFPAKVDLAILKEILRGGIDKIMEAGGVMMGGHTIVDEVPKYGLAVTGTVHPNRIITNAKAKEAEVLILTKAIGAGIVMAGNKIAELGNAEKQAVLESMKQLNKEAAEIIQEFDIQCATDITGFGLAGHALKMAMASNVQLTIDSKALPLFDGAFEMAKLGCLPGACFRNLEYVQKHCDFDAQLSVEHKMLMVDAQTSGGLLISCPENKAEEIVNALSKSYPMTKRIGFVEQKKEKYLVLR
jgi:selenide,water dikinase